MNELHLHLIHTSSLHGSIDPVPPPPHCSAHSAHGSAQVSSATSTIMVFFMSSANVGQFVVFGMLDLEYALVYGTVGVVGAICRA